MKLISIYKILKLTKIPKLADTGLAGLFLISLIIGALRGGDY
jgi:hypothetical protein